MKPALPLRLPLRSPSHPTQRSAQRPPQPRGCSSFKARQLARLLSRHYDAELAGSGLKTTQYSLLSHVLDLQPIAPGELARRMGLEASTLTRNLRPLLAAGWLLQDAGIDGRSRSITLTPEGRDKVIEARQAWKAAQRKINALLGVDRVIALHALLDDCSAMLEKISPAALDDDSGSPP